MEAAHFNHQRNHQGIGNELIDGEPSTGTGPVECVERIGGLLRGIERAVVAPSIVRIRKELENDPTLTTEIDAARDFVQIERRIDEGQLFDRTTAALLEVLIEDHPETALARRAAHLLALSRS